MTADSRFVPQESHQAPPNDSRRIVPTDVPDHRLRRDDDHPGSQDLHVSQIQKNTGESDIEKYYGDSPRR